MTRTFVLRLLSRGTGTPGGPAAGIAGRVEIVHSGEHCAVNNLDELEAVLLRELADGHDQPTAHRTPDEQDHQR